MGITRSLIVAAWGTIVFSCIGVSVAQTSGRPTPCGTAQGDAPFARTNGLWLVPGGANYNEWTVYDSNLGVCWLADANLAGDSGLVKMVNPPSVNADGSAAAINPDAAEHSG